MSATAQIALEKKMRRWLIWVSISALLIVVIAFSVSAWRLRTDAFDPSRWASGKGVYTKDNPRLRMQDEVIRRLNQSHLTNDQLIALLGQPDINFRIRAPGSGPEEIISGNWIYITGVKPKSPMVGQQLEVLNVYVDRTAVLSAYVDEYPFDPGSKVVYVPPTPPKSKGKATHTAKKKP